MMPGVPGHQRPAGPPTATVALAEEEGWPRRLRQPGQAQRGPAAAAAVDPAAAFGGSDIDQAALEKAMADFQLPPELRSRFGK